MKLPTVPEPQPVEYVTPSFYNAALRCPARAAWSRFAPPHALPVGPASVLGSAFHMVTEAAVRGEISTLQDAHNLFTQEVKRSLSETHPLIRRRFKDPVEIPYYRLSQARAAEAAMTIRRSPCSGSGHPSQRLAEKRLYSQSGVIRGRIDLIDTAERAVYDYKSGAEPEEDMTASEIRQLHLYAYLCAEHGIHIDRGVIVRGSGRRNERSISVEEAESEAASAADVQWRFNQSISRGFDALATPSPSACAHCPCIPVCNSFWETADSEWAEQTGVHAEAEVNSITRRKSDGTPLITLELRVIRGTVTPVSTRTDVLPEWISDPTGEEPLEPGRMVRIVNADVAQGSTLLRMGRSGATAIWTVPNEIDSHTETNIA